MWESWNDVFRLTLGPAERSLVSELRDHRNRWAHQEAFSSDDAYRALDSAGRLLSPAVSAPTVRRHREDEDGAPTTAIRRAGRAAKSRKSRRHRDRTATAGGLQALEGEVVTPHKDVASGRYQQAEFAADLWQVHLGEGTDEVQEPRRVLPPHLPDRQPQGDAGGARSGRLAGHGRRPTVVQLQTNFGGGGKTHSMLGCSTTCSRASLPPTNWWVSTKSWRKRSRQEFAEVPARGAGRQQNLARQSRHQVRTAPSSALFRGSLAWQLGGKKAFARVQADDEKATSPGDVLRELFNEYGPCT